MGKRRTVRTESRDSAGGIGVADDPQKVLGHDELKSFQSSDSSKGSEIGDMKSSHEQTSGGSAQSSYRRMVLVEPRATVEEGVVRIVQNGRVVVYDQTQKDDILRQLLDNAETVLHFAVEKHAVDLLDECHRLLRFCLVLTDLYSAFRRSSREMEGPGSVCALLKLSRFGVYARLEAVGITTDDIRNPLRSIDSLLDSNAVLKKIIDELRLKLKKIKGASVVWPQIRITKTVRNAKTAKKEKPR